MSSVRYLVGDVFERMAELPDHSVDLIVTSPPFLALRSYLPSDPSLDTRFIEAPGASPKELRRHRQEVEQ